ncbi:hypothetical protein [Sulfurimonas sp.]|uniref:hypothetical protein n=1 Tax=Sulfurimonas sp. TaxID=2022749 RepID=UPI00262210CD|nr:hypothetical protein [Sulfurimonas sp.]MDD3854904.1 hypothetical protein [Sulfurimonas sp.]
MDALIYLGSWVAIVVLIVVSNIKASKKQGEITFRESSQSYSYKNDIRGTRLFD